MKILASNKKAYFDFDVLDTVMAGVSLLGWEVKSAKAGRVNLSGSYIKFTNGEFFLEGVEISPLKYAKINSHEVGKRQRKLLLTKKQISLFSAKAKQAGNTIVPLEVIEGDNSLVKVNLALVKGRKKFDKRQKLKEKDLTRRLNLDRKKYNL